MTSLSTLRTQARNRVARELARFSGPVLLVVLLAAAVGLWLGFCLVGFSASASFAATIVALALIGSSLPALLGCSGVKLAAE